MYWSATSAIQANRRAGFAATGTRRRATGGTMRKPEFRDPQTHSGNHRPNSFGKRRYCRQTKKRGRSAGSYRPGNRIENRSLRNPFSGTVFHHLPRHSHQPARRRFGEREIPAQQSTHQISKARNRVRQTMGIDSSRYL